MVFLRLLPMLVVMGSIFFLSHQPGDALHTSLFVGQDKLEHFSAYLLLGASVIFAAGPAFRTSSPKSVGLLAVLTCLLYGLGDELHQSFIPGRCPDGWDVVADSAGGLASALLWLWRGRR